MNIRFPQYQHFPLHGPYVFFLTNETSQMLSYIFFKTEFFTPSLNVTHNLAVVIYIPCLLKKKLHLPHVHISVSDMCNTSNFKNYDIYKIHLLAP